MITPLGCYLFKVADPSRWIAKLKPYPTMASKSCGGVMNIVQTRWRHAANGSDCGFSLLLIDITAGY